MKLDTLHSIDALEKTNAGKEMSKRRCGHAIFE